MDGAVWTTRWILVLQVFYWAIVILSMISIYKPYHLPVQIIFYIFNGLFATLYIYIEITKSVHITVKALHYCRLIATTVAVGLIFSVFSGYHRFSAAYSYDVRSHLMLFVPNSIMFMVKLPYIIHPYVYAPDSIKATREKAERDKSATVIRASKPIKPMLLPGDEIVGVMRIATSMLLAAFLVVLVIYFSS